ncbi:MAG: hypothetical protein K6E10_00250 [Eubacterium sp.]|nr:hypothetical protein [Eubacterium sp.]
MPKKKHSREEKADYKKKMSQFILFSDHKYDEITSIYGPNGKLEDMYGKENKDKYDGIEINVPNNMDINECTGIILGAMIDPNGLDADNISMGNKLSKNEKIEGHQMLIIENINSDNNPNRTKNVVPLLIERKKVASKAINYFSRTGKNVGVSPLAKNMVDHGSGLATSCIPFNPRNSFSKNLFSKRNMSIYLANHVYGKKFGTLMDENKKIQYKKLINVKKQMDAAEKAGRIKAELLNSNNIIPGSKDRKRLVEELMFNQLLAATSCAAMEEINKKDSNLLDSILKKHGITGSNFENNEYDGDYRKLNNNNEYSVAERELKETILAAYRENTITDIEAILSDENGIEKLKNAYKKAIEGSSLYKEMVNASNEDLLDLVMNFDNESRKGLNMFEGVDLKNAAEPYNNEKKSTLESIIKKETEKISEAIVNANVELNGEECGIDDFGNQQFINNALIINDLYDDLDNLTGIRGSGQNFKDLQKSLGNFKDYTNMLKDTEAGNSFTKQQYDEYIRRGKEVLRLTDKYLDNKVINSDYAQTRFNGVADFKRKFATNLKMFENTYTGLSANQKEAIDDYNKKLEEKCDDAYKQIDYYRVHRKPYDPFTKGKNPPGTQINSPEGYSVTRNAVYSIAIMALAAQNKDPNKPHYTLEEIMNPNKLGKEKAEMYDKAVECVTNNTAENQKWIAENIYNGLFEVGKIVNTEAGKIDFNNPAYKDSKLFNMISSISYYQFDAWQELAHCKNETVAIVKENNKNIEINDYDDAKHFLSGQTSYFDEFGSVGLNKFIYLNKYFKNGDTAKLGECLDSLVAQRAYEKINKDAIEKGGDFNGYLNVKQKEKLATFVHSKMAAFFKDLKNIDNSPEVKDKIYRKIADESIVKNMTLTLDLDNPDESKIIRVKGIPSLEDIKEEIEFEKIPEKMVADSFEERISKYEKLSNKAERSEQNKGYMKDAFDACKKLQSLTKGNEAISNDKKNEAIECINKIIKAEYIDILEKSGLKGRDLDESLDDVAKEFRDMRNRDYIDKATLFKYGGSNFVENIVTMKKDNIVKYAKAQLNNKEFKALVQRAENDLKANNYGSNKKKFIKDAVLVMTKKMNDYTGLGFTKGNKNYGDLMESANLSLQDKRFLEFIKNEKNPERAMTASEFLDWVNNEENVKKFVNDYNKKSHEMIEQKKAAAEAKKNSKKTDKKTNNKKEEKKIKK